MLATVVLAAGCGGDEREYTVLQPDYTFAGETLHDWVSNGHQLSVVSVVDATAPRPAARDSGGLIDREVTVDVERTLWRREGAPRAARTLRFDVWGWMQESDQDPESPRTNLVSEADGGRQPLRPPPPSEGAPARPLDRVARWLRGGQFATIIT